MSTDSPRVLVNAIAARRGGGARHLEPFLGGLAHALPTGHVHACVSPDVGTLSVGRNLTIEVQPVDAGLNRRRLVWDQYVVRRRARAFQVLISPLNIGTIRAPVPQIVFQRNTVYFDQAYFRLLSPQLRARFSIERSFVLRAARSAERIVVPSQAMAQLLEPYLHDIRRIHIIPHGFDHQRASERASAPVPPSAIPWSRAPTRLLHVGHPLVHKNLPLLVLVLWRLRRSGIPAELAVTFAPNDPSPAAEAFARLAGDMRVSEHVHFLGAVAADDVYALCRAATVFLSPSVTESFGFSVLEALAVGTPVVLSDIPSARELADGVAEFHDPNDADSAAELVLEVLNSDSQEQVAARRERAKRFSWTAHCQRVAALIRELSSG